MTQPPLLRLFKGGFAAFLEFGAFTPPCKGGESRFLFEAESVFILARWNTTGASRKHRLEEEALVPALPRPGIRFLSFTRFSGG
jgi:hypothetical protein